MGGTILPTRFMVKTYWAICVSLGVLSGYGTRRAGARAGGCVIVLGVPGGLSVCDAVRYFCPFAGIRDCVAISACRWHLRLRRYFDVPLASAIAWPFQRATGICDCVAVSACRWHLRLRRYFGVPLAAAIAWPFQRATGIRDAPRGAGVAGRHLLFFAAAKKSRQKKAAHTASP
ncbi:hypothetical protein [Paraburkholderia diazotrophica]|uniref:hypothetical protein n=1 Tax=Paraburkholderia diazotrophica TaxID=667676 RepID=UPI00316C4C21